MLANAIKQTTTTTGTGNLTLAAVAGYVEFSDAFALNQPFFYALVNAVNQLVETGIGYLSTSTTLVRAKITSTFSGGTYTDEGASAASLTGTTTVLCTPQAASIESMLPTVDGTTAGINRFVSSAARNLATATVGLTTNRCYYLPFLLRTGATINSLACNVTTAGATGVVARLGIYALSVDGYIGTQLATTADIAMDTTGVKNASLAAPITLPPGWYYVAIVASGSPGVTTWNGSGTNLIGGGPLGFASGSVTAIEYRYEALGSAVLPAAASSTTVGVNVGSGNPPAIYMGVS